MKKLTKTQITARQNKKKINKLFEKTKKKIIGKSQKEISKIWENYRQQKFEIKHPVKTEGTANELRLKIPVTKIFQNYDFTKIINRVEKISKEKTYISLTIFTEVQKFVDTEDEFLTPDTYYIGISQTYLQKPINKPNFKDFIEYFFADYLNDLQNMNKSKSGDLSQANTGKLKNSQIRLFFE